MNEAKEGNAVDTRYDVMLRKAIGIAFILGPVLLLTAALILVSGIGMNPNDLDSYVEGAFGFYAFLLFIPIWITLAKIIGRTYPKFGIFLTVMGTFSAAAGTVPMTNRMMQKGLTDRGIDLEIWDLMDEPLLMAVVLPTAPMFALLSALFGIGLLLTRTFDRWVGVALIAAMPPFYLAQAGGVAVTITWTLTAALYVVALAPIGLRILRTGSVEPESQTVPEIATA
jgi:hypothetical protein